MPRQKRKKRSASATKANPYEPRLQKKCNTAAAKQIGMVKKFALSLNNTIEILLISFRKIPLLVHASERRLLHFRIQSTLSCTQYWLEDLFSYTNL